MGAALSFLGQKLFASSTLINAKCENISCCTSVAAVQPLVVRRTGGFLRQQRSGHPVPGRQSPQSWPQSWTAARSPAIAPLATAAALATTDGQVAAHGSSIAALQSSLTMGLSNKADQSAFDVLEGVVATKSTPDGGPEAVQLQHHGGHERFHRLGQQRHAGHGGRQLRPQDGGGPALPRHSGEDHAAGGGHQGGQRSPGAVTAAALASKLASQDAFMSGPPRRTPAP